MFEKIKVHDVSFEVSAGGTFERLWPELCRRAMEIATARLRELPAELTAKLHKNAAVEPTTTLEQETLDKIGDEAVRAAARELGADFRRRWGGDITLEIKPHDWQPAPTAEGVTSATP